MIAYKKSAKDLFNGQAGSWEIGIYEIKKT